MGRVGGGGGSWKLGDKAAWSESDERGWMDEELDWENGGGGMGRWG